MRPFFSANCPRLQEEAGAHSLPSALLGRRWSEVLRRPANLPSREGAAGLAHAPWALLHVPPHLVSVLLPVISEIGSRSALRAVSDSGTAVAVVRGSDGRNVICGGSPRLSQLSAHSLCSRLASSAALHLRPRLWSHSALHLGRERMNEEKLIPCRLLPR